MRKSFGRYKAEKIYPLGKKKPMAETKTIALKVSREELQKAAEVYLHALNESNAEIFDITAFREGGQVTVTTLEADA